MNINTFNTLDKFLNDRLFKVYKRILNNKNFGIKPHKILKLIMARFKELTTDLNNINFYYFNNEGIPIFKIAKRNKRVSLKKLKINNDTSKLIREIPKTCEWIKIEKLFVRYTPYYGGVEDMEQYDMGYDDGYNDYNLYTPISDNQDYLYGYDDGYDDASFDEDMNAYYDGYYDGITRSKYNDGGSGTS